MCGIAGMIAQKALSSGDRDCVTSLNRAMIHRGPDGEGQYYSDHIALAMRRLSIIDLTAGWQPLYNEDRSVVLVANGEIYNFVELRKNLESSGHRFHTHTDCEVIVHLYEKYGLECVHHLRGMFAFALWDTKLNRLMLARDRMGEKPIYLYEQQGRLIFASELKGLLSSGIIRFELDPCAVDLYFHYQYVPEPMTPIKSVHKLPAAHIMTVTLDPWRVQKTCYWRMEDAPRLDGRPVDLIRAELETIGEIVIRSDVPVGVALSGGLDSSAIAALATRKYPGTMHAFSVGYVNRPPSDERADAKALADYLGMPFHEVELDTDDMVSFFPELIYQRDDPIADISGFGYYAVMKLAKQKNVPVMLQGHGGDELFWGYPWVRQAAEESTRKSRSSNIRPKILDYLALGWPEKLSPGQLKRWAKSLGGLQTAWKYYQRDMRSPSDQLIFYDLTPDFKMACAGMTELYSQRFKEEMAATHAYDLFTVPSPWPQVDILITRLICQTYLLENGIAQGDRLSMASSVELRLPLVDYRLVETVIGLRKSQSDHRFPAKHWFKQSLRGILPDWVLERPKRGFAPPVNTWHNALFAKYGDALIDGFLVRSGVLTSRAAQGLAQGVFPSGAVAPVSFKALVLELWCRKFSSLGA